jgi:hypothetical protein
MFIVIISAGLLAFIYIFFKALYSALLGCGAGLQIALLLEQVLIFWNSVQTGCIIPGTSFTNSGTRGTYASVEILRLDNFGYGPVLCTTSDRTAFTVFYTLLRLLF